MLVGYQRCEESQGFILPVLTQEVPFVFAEGFDLCGLFVNHPVNDLDRFVVLVDERVVPSRDGVVAPSVFAFKLEGANVASESHVLVVEASHARQVIEAIHASFGELVLFIFHVFNLSELCEKSRDFFSYSSSIRRHQPHTASRLASPLRRGCCSHPYNLRYTLRIPTGSNPWHRQRR